MDPLVEAAVVKVGVVVGHGAELQFVSVTAH